MIWLDTRQDNSANQPGGFNRGTLLGVVLCVSWLGFLLCFPIGRTFSLIRDESKLASRKTETTKYTKHTNRNRASSALRSHFSFLTCFDLNASNNPSHCAKVSSDGLALTGNFSSC